MSKISASESLRKSWSVFKKNWQILIYAILIPFLFDSIVSSLFKIDTSKKNFFLLYPANVLISFMITRYLVSNFFEIGKLKIYLDSLDGKLPRYSELFSVKGNYTQFLIASILLGLCVLGGLIFFVIPGIYILLTYSFAPILILDKKISIGDAFETSKKMTDGRKMEILLFSSGCAIFALSGVIALLVGIVVTFIVANLAFVDLYRVLLKDSELNEDGGQLFFDDLETPVA